MKIPMSWLRDYVTVDATIHDFVEDITLSGSKVEGWESTSGSMDGIVVGKIVKIDPHPDADKLVITQIDIGQAPLLTIVTGAKNIQVNDFVPVALDGAILADGTAIHTGMLRGVESQGMLCSVEELGCDRQDFPEAPEHGIYIFPEEVSLGENALAAMDLIDDVVEFEITSNRPDCFSVIGLARETAATYRTELRYPEISVAEKGQGKTEDMISVTIENPQLCPRYIARVVKNVKIQPSPRWMRKRLRAAGLRPINNIVDITNYVMLELGQPMHAFDIDAIAQRQIIVRNARAGEGITTLDGTQRELDPSMLVIADPEKAVAVAGVMGGENSKISDTAEAILFESANFNGPNVRLTAKKLGMRTDASGKYEKGLDPNLALDAVNRAVQLVELLQAGEVVPGLVDAYPNKREPWTLSYDPDRINRLLGTHIIEMEMKEIFERIGLHVDMSTRTVTVPTYRPDLEGHADLAEEVARFYGYDKIEPTLAAGTPTVGKRTHAQQIQALIKNAMIGSGLCEAMTISFESPKVFDKLMLPKESPLRNAIQIANPLGEDYSVMRTLSLHAILTSLSTNYNRRNESAALFEIGKVYLADELPLQELPEEKQVLTIAMYGEADFYSLKGIVEHLLEVLGMRTEVEYQSETSLSWMHPGRTAMLSVKEEFLGYIGELHPAVAANYEIGTRAYVAVLEIAQLEKHASLVNRYCPLPRFPAIVRDLAMLVDEKITVRTIEQIIQRHGGDFLEAVQLFDVYQGVQIEAGKKSVAYTLSFRAPERTLTDKDVAEPISAIVTALSEELHAQLRDK